MSSAYKSQKRLCDQKEKKKSRFKSFKEHQQQFDEDFANRMTNTQVRGNVRRRTDMLNKSNANEKNLYRQMKTVWDVLVNSNLPPAQVMKVARNYIQQYNQNRNNKGNQEQEQGF